MTYFLSFYQKNFWNGKRENIRDLGCGEQVNSEGTCKKRQDFSSNGTDISMVASIDIKQSNKLKKISYVYLQL